MIIGLTFLALTQQVKLIKRPWQEEKSQDVYSSWGSKLPDDVVIEFENFSAFPATSTDKVGMPGPGADDSERSVFVRQTIEVHWSNRTPNNS